MFYIILDVSLGLQKLQHLVRSEYVSWPSELGIKLYLDIFLVEDKKGIVLESGDTLAW